MRGLKIRFPERMLTEFLKIDQNVVPLAGMFTQGAFQQVSLRYSGFSVFTGTGTQDDEAFQGEVVAVYAGTKGKKGKKRRSGDQGKNIRGFGQSHTWSRKVTGTVFWSSLQTISPVMETRPPFYRDRIPSTAEKGEPPSCSTPIILTPARRSSSFCMRSMPSFSLIPM